MVSSKKSLKYYWQQTWNPKFVIKKTKYVRQKYKLEILACISSTILYVRVHFPIVIFTGQILHPKSMLNGV